MTEAQKDQTPRSSRAGKVGRTFYMIIGVAGLVILVQLLALRCPRDNRVAVDKAITPRPTRTATLAPTAAPTATLPPSTSTNTPSLTWTSPPPTDTPTSRPTTTATSTSTRAPTETLFPTETPTPTPEGTLGAAYVRDVTIRDYAVITPGKSFDKTWRIANSGTRTWPSGARLAFVEGQQMGGATSEPLGREVAPGEEVDVTVPMTAPDEPGTYKGTWQMQTPEGESFGAKLYVAIRAGTLPRPTAVPTAAPVSLLEMVDVDNGEWGIGWMRVKYQDDIYVDGSDGHRYRGEMGFLSSPEALATIQEYWGYGGRGSATWKMTVRVRTQVGWVSCASDANICYEATVWSSQALLTSEVFYRPNVWSSLLESYLAGGLLATTQNSYYQDIQRTVFEPICNSVPDKPAVGFKFTRVD